MTTNLALVVAIVFLVGCGTTLVLERSLTRILIGFFMIGNGVNLVFIVASGPRGRAPIVDGSDGAMSDPLPQAMVLTAIVIALGVTAFGLALAYRAWQLTGHDDVQDDLEDDLVRRRADMDTTSATFDDVAAGLPDEEGVDEPPSPADPDMDTADHRPHTHPQEDS
ncbi:Na(+)/H(+) antiporter subunit C [Aeromicrobium sp. CF4.19]|uniref:Na(+)/H(+) antiporter subunit C n=1 Tax=Aeromicrobium sp. CF4.19 TaxID=3373082 RepID=UPI003EE75A4D